MAAYQDRYWDAADGTRLHARDYPGDEARVPVVCLHGLTRNARDFAQVAERLKGSRRVIAANFRGRGGSAAARDAATYSPGTYVADTTLMLEALGIERFVAFGTSLGGIVTMLIAEALPGRIAGALLNDIGPKIEAGGLSRIRSYVGKPSSLPTWMHAARCAEEVHGSAHPDWGIGEWLAFAKRLYRLNSAGRVVLDYDLRIAEPFRVPGNEAAPDLWGSYDALAPVPVLIVRGALSDILSAETADAMAGRLPMAELVTVPRVGHAPVLDEPPVVHAIDRLLARVPEPLSA